MSIFGISLTTDDIKNLWYQFKKLHIAYKILLILLICCLLFIVLYNKQKTPNTLTSNNTQSTIINNNGNYYNGNANSVTQILNQTTKPFLVGNDVVEKLINFFNLHNSTTLSDFQKISVGEKIIIPLTETQIELVKSIKDELLTKKIVDINLSAGTVIVADKSPDTVKKNYSFTKLINFPK